MEKVSWRGGDREASAHFHSIPSSPSVVESISDKYSEFRDNEGPVIYDVDEERAIRERLMDEGRWEEIQDDEKRRQTRTAEDVQVSSEKESVFSSS